MDLRDTGRMGSQLKLDRYRSKSGGGEQTLEVQSTWYGPLLNTALQSASHDFIQPFRCAVNMGFRWHPHCRSLIKRLMHLWR